MRTARISNSGQSIYKSERKINTVGDLAFQSSLNQSPHQHQQEGRKKQEKKQNRQVKLSTNKGMLIIKGIRLGGESGAVVHNYLLRNARVIQYCTKIKVRNTIYKTSI
jgi:hypothetical protein